MCALANQACLSCTGYPSDKPPNSMWDTNCTTLTLYQTPGDHVVSGAVQRCCGDSQSRCWRRAYACAFNFDLLVSVMTTK